MAHKHDYWEGIRGWLIPKLGGIAHFLSDVLNDRYYVESATQAGEFVGRVDMGEEEFEKVLHDMGFQRNPLAAWKHLAKDTDQHEEGSFRWIPPEDSDLDQKMQLHVILYDGSARNDAETGYTYVYAHWEYRWDVGPWKHYRGYRHSHEQGVEIMTRRLNEQGVEFEDADSVRASE